MICLCYTVLTGMVRRKMIQLLSNKTTPHFQPLPMSKVLSDFINLTQVHNFTVTAQDSFTFRRRSVFTVSFTGILPLLMQIMK